MSTEHGVILTWRNLHLADDAVRRLLDARLGATVGCSLLEHDLLAWLAAAEGQRMQMLDLAHSLGVSRGGLTRIVDRLAGRGWVDRDRPEHNRREVHAFLTVAGRRVIRRARTVYAAVLTETLGTHLEAAELDQLTRITSKLLAALGRRPDC